MFWGLSEKNIPINYDGLAHYKKNYRSGFDLAFYCWGFGFG